MTATRRVSAAGRFFETRRWPLLLMLVMLLFALRGAAQTCDYSVTSLADSGPGTLRAGLLDPAVTNICINGSGTITLASTLQIVNPVTITGSVTIDGNNQVQIFNVNLSSSSYAVRINGLTLTHGNTSNSGGALQVTNGNVTLVATTISGNTAVSGGGVYNQSNLTLSQCGISSNSASSGAGGGIYNDANAVLTMQGTTMTQNSSTTGAGGLYNAGTASISGGMFTGNTGAYGGAIYNEYYANLPITGGTTFSNNTASVSGGAIFNIGSTMSNQMLFTGNAAQGTGVETPACGGAICNSGTATIGDSTFTQNSSAQNGGAVGNTGTLTLVNDTLYSNSAVVNGSSVDNESSGVPTIKNSILVGATPSTNPSCYGCTGITGNNVIDVEPYLGPLANNGGPTYTMMPLPGGPEIAAGNPNDVIDDTDQRGFNRSSATQTVDIGAVQSHYSAITYRTQPSNALINQAITPPVQVQVLEVDPLSGSNNYPQGVPVIVSLYTSQGIPASTSLAGTLTELPGTTTGVTAATFPDLAVNTAGSYELQATIVPAALASSASLNPAYGTMSSIFQISNPPVVTLSWQPAPLTYGPLPASELNATATVNGSPATGTFVYTFTAGGATINVGQTYPVGTYGVQVTFTPVGSTSQYTLGTSLQITQATPVLTWPAPAAIYTSTPLGSAQLDATAAGVSGAALPGTFVYNPPAGTTLAAGSHVLSTTFTPTDSTDYSTNTSQVTIQVNSPNAASISIQESANPITFGKSETLTAMVVGSDGQPYSGGSATFTSDGTSIGTATVSNGSASISTSSLTAGTHQIGVSYTNALLSQPLSGSAALTVNKATPVLAWATPAAIFTVTSLSSTQLDATATGVNGATLPGTFVYSPAAGALLPAGTQTLSTTFTPTDALNYSVATAQVTIQVGYSTIAIASVSPSTTPLATAPLTVTVTGSGFTSTSVAEINGVAIATKVQSATSLTSTIPAADLASVGTLKLSVYDPASKFTSNVVQLPVTAPAPNLTFSITPTTGSGEQPTINLGLNSPYPSDLQGTLTLTFSSSGTTGVDDPAIQFSTGGRTLNFTIPANSTTTPQVALQTGTVAGTITVTLTLTAGGVDVTPADLAPVTLLIAPSAPVITSVTFTNNSQGQITVVVSGFSNTREVSLADFVFSGADANRLHSSHVNVSVVGLFSPWYGSTDSDQYGSEFTYTQNFQLSKPDAGLTGVAVTLTNSVGASGSVNSQ